VLYLLKIFYIKQAIRLCASGDFFGAEKVLEKVMARKADVDVLIRYAKLATARKDWGSAVDRWERVIFTCDSARQAIPKAAVVQLEKARLAQAGELRKAGDLDESEQLLEKVLALSPDHVGALTQHAKLATARKDWGSAVDRWERVIYSPVIPPGKRFPRPRLFNWKKHAWPKQVSSGKPVTLTERRPTFLDCFPNIPTTKKL